MTLKLADDKCQKTDDKTEDDEQESHPSSSKDDDLSGIEKMSKYLMSKLTLSDTEEKMGVKAKQILQELTIRGIVDFIKENKCRNIITISGAGISTSAGIPDFRSPSSGLYYNLQKYNLPYPQAIFEIDFFKTNPEPFFVLAKELLPEHLKPTLSHYFIKLLSDKGLLLRHYTQNIDTLERISGLPPEKLVEAHGTFHSGRCLDCRATYDLSWMKKKLYDETIPKCDKCLEGVVKPDIIFFGEMLPERFYHSINNDFPKADLLIIMGSSLVVQPFASLIDKVKSTCPRLLINKEKVSVQDRLSRFFGLNHGFVFDPKSSECARDVAWIGDCDTGCKLLAEELGWNEELEKLMENDHRRIDAEKSEESK
ncbi:NAD-dependent protein deacetylase sirtuin-2 isoform X1 [Cotesia glomerata]|uniref:NAD-dependent protein deacetylase sirtuin-2 isoform X1 n=1 Tax=Cotesia glomerata TaxID=32391 RepID=UPI001D021511|nr:NAD-dependent protein deacetylase sirtuin-2 isoform X1 [Cotesia glomerata]